MKLTLTTAALLLACTGTANAQFFDNFNGENGGAEALNYNSLTNWTVTNGTIDLIGNGGTYDFLPGNGLYIDLDGTSNDAGNLVSVSIFLNPGVYFLGYDIAGSRRSGSPTDIVDVSMGGYYAATHTMTWTDGFTSVVSGPIVIGAPTVVTLSFQDRGSDNQGALLDNVWVSVPTPGAAALAGVGGLAALRRRRR